MNRIEAWLQNHVPAWWKAHFIQWNIIIGVFLTYMIQIFYVSWWNGNNIADISLWGCQYATEDVPCPAYFQKIGLTNPEGWLWFVLNFASETTVFLTEQQYVIYTAFFFWGMIGFALWTRRIPLEIITITVATSLMFIFGYGHTYQNLTIIAFMPFMYVVPWVGIIPLLQKLPIGPWDFWNLQNKHWDCAFHCGGNYYDLANLLAHMSNWLALVVLWLMPLLFRYMRGKRLNTGDMSQDLNRQ